MPLFKTFLYAIRDIPRTYTKFGYCTADDLPSASKHLLSRYGTSYLDPELLQLVPVATLGTKAERRVKRALAQYHVKREFLQFPDETTMREKLAALYAELECVEAAAFTVERCRESAEERQQRRQARGEARTVATAAAVETCKRKAEVVELQHEEKRMRLEACAQRSMKKLAAGGRWVGGVEQERDEVVRWVATYTERSEGSHFTSSEAFKHFAGNGGAVSQRAFKARLASVLKGCYFAQKKMSGVNRTSVFIDMVFRQNE